MASPPVTDVSTGRKARGRVRLLVVDGSPEHRARLRRRLEDVGMRVRAAGDAGQALELVDGVDLVLLDHGLADADDLDLLRAIRERSAPPSVILLTDAGSTEVAVAAMRAGAINYVTKGPGYLDALPEIVDRAWEHHDLATRAVELQRLALLLSSAADRRTLFAEVVAGVMRLLRARSCALLVDEDGRLSPVGGAGPDRERLEAAAAAMTGVATGGPWVDGDRLVVPLPSESGDAVGVLLVSAGDGPSPDDRAAADRAWAGAVTEGERVTGNGSVNGESSTGGAAVTDQGGTRDGGATEAGSSTEAATDTAAATDTPAPSDTAAATDPPARSDTAAATESGAGSFTGGEVELAGVFASFAGLALGRLRQLELERLLITELQQTLDARRDFVASISHELRTPLTSIAGFTQTLRLHWDALDAERRIDLLERVERNADGLRTLVEELLDLARLERGRAEQVRVETLGVHGQVTQVLEQLERVLDGREVRVRIDPLEVRADASLLRRSVANLIANAVKFSEVETPVDVRAVAEGTDRVRIEVVDRGIGLPPWEVSRVFDPFFRARSSVANAVRGSGIGLALVREYVRAMDGEVFVESEPGAGSTFGIVLPRAGAPEGAAAEMPLG